MPPGSAQSCDPIPSSIGIPGGFCKTQDMIQNLGQKTGHLFENCTRPLESFKARDIVFLGCINAAEQEKPRKVRLVYT